MSHNLIITADDYGMCASVNDGIHACLEAGTLRTTCVMVNMPASEAAANLRKRFPECSVGIHWTLTQGSPILPPSQVMSLVDGSGHFRNVGEFRRRWIRGRIEKEEVRAELTAQYRRLANIAGPPEFWNTHQDAHVFPGLFQICVALGSNLRIPAMRCHRRITVPFLTTSSTYHLQHPLFWLKGKIISRWARQAEKQHVRMPDARVYMPGYKGPAVARLENVVGRLPWSGIQRAIELIVHPATKVDEGLFGTLTESRVREYQVLRDSNLAERLRSWGINPVGFEAVLAAA